MASSPSSAFPTNSSKLSPRTRSPWVCASMRSSSIPISRIVYAEERSALRRCVQRNWSSSKCSSAMSGMKASISLGGGELVDRDGAAFDAIHALGVGDEVLAFDEDLAVVANRYASLADAKGE